MQLLSGQEVEYAEPAHTAFYTLHKGVGGGGGGGGEELH